MQTEDFFLQLSQFYKLKRRITLFLNYRDYTYRMAQN